MNLYEIRNQLQQGKRVYDLKLRVVYYARVSTDKYDQLNSLSNQVNYYEELINNNANWEFVGGYIDEGISGTLIKKRINFNRMIKDAKLGLFDLIITKEISRFARDTLTSIQYTRELLANGIGVFFQNDNILTFDMESELRLTIMASIAQEEVRKLSERVKFGFKQQIEKGSVLGNDSIWGYIKDKRIRKGNDKCRLVIVPEEAKIIKLIYDLYVNHNMGMRLIGLRLADMGIFSKTGKPFAQSTIKSILTNPKYKGYYCGNKTRVIDYHSKKRVNINKEEWKLYKDKDVPKIIDEDIWDKAQDIIKMRSSKVANDKRIYQNRYPFSGKIICMEHKKTYRRKKQVSSGIKRKEIITWRCSEFLLNNKDKCKGPIIYEEELINIIIKKVFDNIKLKDVVDELIEEYKRIDENNNIREKIIIKEKELEKLYVYKDNLYGLLKDNIMELEEFKNKYFDNELKIKELKEIIDNMKLSCINSLNKDNDLLNLKGLIINRLKDNNIDSNNIIKEFLNYIEVYNEDNNRYLLKIFFNIGYSVNVYYNNKKHHFYSNNTYDESRC